MELIKYDKDGGPIMMHVEINDVPIWSFSYTGASGPIENDSENGNPAPYTLDKPGNHKVGSWDIHFGNISNGTADIESKITWTQDGVTLKIWSRHIQILADQAGIVSGNALYILKPVS